MVPLLVGSGTLTEKKSTNSLQQGIHVIAKPAGPACNLNCEYCFYLEKKALFDHDTKYRMSDDVLRAFINGYVTSQPTPVVEFVWQGGEPTMLGIDFFEHVIEFQKPFAGTRNIVNSLQTNGTLLTDEWCMFLKKNHFLVGISIDGPKDIHDRYRRDRNGNGSFDRAMNGLELLKKHEVEYNVLACVARDTARSPLDIYQFFKNEGIEYIQFTPVIERIASPSGHGPKLRLAGPASLDMSEPSPEITEWSVIPEQYGDFLIAIYEEWIRHDVGKHFIMNFEWALNAWIGNPSPICVHADRCGYSVIIEHNGDVYACDHCVYPEYRLGNITSDTFPAMIERSRRMEFGITKETLLPRWCRECDVLAACRGGCPKDRFAKTWYDEPGLHYLCEGYKKFFLHIRKYLRAMATLLENGLPASRVMDAIKGPLVITIKNP